MARRRHQTKGHLHAKGPSWLLEWREYMPNGDIIRRSEAIGPRTGAGRITKREAERLAWERYLSPLDDRSRRPSSAMILEAFIAQYFAPQVTLKRKKAGQMHYGYVISKINPLLGHMRLCDIGPAEVEYAVAEIIESGLSNQTALHVRNGVSAIFRLAKRLKLYGDDNPASGVEVPEVIPQARPTYSVGQLQLVLGKLASPYREMCYLAVCTSMNVAEICGLKRKWVNLTSGTQTVDGEVMAPMSLAVREHYYRNTWGSLKCGKRRRNISLNTELAEMMAAVTRKRQEPDATFFQSRTGSPVDAHNVGSRHFRPLAETLGFPVTWHAFRRAHSTLAGGLAGVALEDRMRTMGHAEAAMTLFYSVDDVERRRAIPQGIWQALLGKTEGGVQ